MTIWATAPDAVDPLSAANVMPNILRYRATHEPDAVFLRDLDRGTTTTYSQFEDLVASWASVLVALQVKEGDAVVSVLPNCVDAIALWMATARVGAVEFPLNAAYKGNLLTHMIGNAAAAVVVTCEDHLDGVLAVVPNLAAVRTVVMINGPSRPADASVTIVGFDDVAAGGPLPVVEPRVLQPWDLSCVMYTSGTTGPSKGVMVTWAQVFMSTTGCFPVDGFTASDHWYIPFPLFHMSGKLCVNGAVLHGAEAVIRARFSLSKFWSDVDSNKCTTSLMIGSVPQLIGASDPSPDDLKHTLRNVEIAPMPAEPREFAARFGIRISTVFNMTEISCPVITGWDEFKIGSVGRQREGYQVRIVDEHDIEVPRGTIGEIIVRSDRPWLLNVGYWRMPEKTAEAWINGWFHSGDAGYIDEDGNFYFLDRIKDAIRSRGENISSMELEAEIGECPGVLECAVVGVPSSLGEEDIVAYIVPETDDFDPATVHTFCQERLPKFMVPRFVVLITELPKTPTEKIKKPILREAWPKTSAWDALTLKDR
jgi:crotonobetaine/carnitine-CoA ligase